MSYPTKGRADYLELGDWNACCEMCGRKRKASTLVRNWQGGWRCPEHNEERQPQDFVRSVPDVQTPPWTQPMPAYTYAARCTPNGSTAYPGYAIPNCAMPDYISPMFDSAVEMIDYSQTVLEVSALSAGTVYQIRALGNTNWAAIGYSGIPTFGGIFTATGAGSGTGLVVVF